MAENLFYIDNRLEDTIIGECLIEDVFSTVLEKGVCEEYFMQPNARAVFRIMESLQRNGRNIDIVTVCSKARENGDFVLLQYAIGTTQLVYSAAHLLTHIECLENIYFKREVASAGKMLAESISTLRQDELLQYVKDITDDLREKKFGSDALSITELLDMASDSLKVRIDNRTNGKATGITTGLSRLDEMTGGWEKQRLTVFAGRPGMGKTAAAIHFAISAAKQGESVLFHSLEMGGVEIADRMICASSSINVGNYKHGRIGDEEKKQLEKSYDELSGLPIYVNSTAIQSTSYIWACAKMMKDKGCCNLLIVDYLQLVDMTSGANRNLNKEQLVSKTSREFKLMAKELDIPIIVLSQLNRGVEGRKSKMPELSDLRDSGSIEQDADNVMFIYRPEYYEDDEPTQTAVSGIREDGEIIVKKQRNGPTGSVQFAYNESLTHIFDIGAIAEEIEIDEKYKLLF